MAPEREHDGEVDALIAIGEFCAYHLYGDLLQPIMNKIVTSVGRGDERVTQLFVKSLYFTMMNALKRVSYADIQSFEELMKAFDALVSLRGRILESCSMYYISNLNSCFFSHFWGTSSFRGQHDSCANMLGKETDGAFTHDEWLTHRYAIIQQVRCTFRIHFTHHLSHIEHP
jgi:hypothetical protein